MKSNPCYVPVRIDIMDKRIYHSFIIKQGARIRLKTLKTVVVLLFMALMLVANGLADEIKLKNGDRLTGKIVKSEQSRGGFEK